ncbi:MAG TPA: hypothetical protein VGG09_13840 [Acidimicrobiales bacterium]|jgi:hypothetical protein
MSIALQPERVPAVTAVAALSLAAGAALLLAPTQMGRALGVESGPKLIRAMGLVDLAIAPGLYFGRPQWRWMMARGALNPLMAGIVAAKGGSTRAKVFAVGLLGATFADLHTATKLHSEAVKNGPRRP